MLKTIASRFSFYRWYFFRGKRLIITIPLFIDTIYMWVSAFLYTVLLFPALRRMGGLLIFLLGAGFLLSLSPIMMAWVYSSYPNKKTEKLKKKQPEISETRILLIVIVNMIMLRVFISVLFYFINLLINS